MLLVKPLASNAEANTESSASLMINSPRGASVLAKLIIIIPGAGGMGGTFLRYKLRNNCSVCSSRMSSATRLLAVLELLQNYGSVSVKKLAELLEVDARTVRRYVTSLQDMGIPVAAERGPYGAYQLERGSRLPPLIYNDTEASAIVLGLTAMRQMNFPIDAVSIEAALAKTKRVLPERLFSYVNDLEHLIKVHNPV